MCFEVFDKFNSLIISLPKLNVAITTCCNKKFCSAKYIIVLCINYNFYTGTYYSIQWKQLYELTQSIKFEIHKEKCKDVKNHQTSDSCDHENNA